MNLNLFINDILEISIHLNTRQTHLYLLFKINMINDSGRLIIRAINSHTIQISIYIDQYIRPLAKTLKSYVGDTK